MEKKFVLPELGYEVTLGKFAQQADGGVWLQQGGTVVLSTVVSAPSAEFPGFLPLTVDYREQFSAAGKIPGGYFKREGKFSDYEVLVSRLIDRAIRPLFVETYFDKLQILATVYSVDKIHVPEVLGLLATSIALTISNKSFMGPVGAAEVVRVDGQFVVNPVYAQIQNSDFRIIVAGTEDGICMIEGSAGEVSESEVIDALFLAHDTIKKQVRWQKEIQQSFAVNKTEAMLNSVSEPLDWKTWASRAHEVLTRNAVEKMFHHDKVERTAVKKNLKEQFLERFASEIEASEVSETFLEYIFDMTLRDCITDLCFVLGKRVDERAFDEVRPISTEVGLLPFTHGSALFTRGRTQALASVTLGGGQDKIKTDTLMGNTVASSFMLHYNFPSFSVGEVRPQRGPGRREVGHGYLATTALTGVLPDQETFPYTIRIVTDILESDGSSSMATVCSSTMALMDAGVPIRAMVSGVAMGLLKSSQGEFKILTDIAGIEDPFGLMDFKVAGTEKGITAIQMDIKHKGGLARNVFEQALAAARTGRLHIMKEMQKVMSKPRLELSPLVPQINSFRVPVDKIGAIIGGGGKTIREIIEKTGVAIDIEDDGLVKIYGQPGPGMDQAVGWVKVLGGQIDRGSTYNGIVKRISEFGVFVEIAPGYDGLVHISMIPRPDQQKFMKSVKVGDTMAVEVVDYDPVAGRVRLKPLASSESVH